MTLHHYSTNEIAIKKWNDENPLPDLLKELNRIYDMLCVTSELECTTAQIELIIGKNSDYVQALRSALNTTRQEDGDVSLLMSLVADFFHNSGINSVRNDIMKLIGKCSVKDYSLADIRMEIQRKFNRNQLKLSSTLNELEVPENKLINSKLTTIVRKYPTVKNVSVWCRINMLNGKQYALVTLDTITHHFGGFPNEI